MHTKASPSLTTRSFDACLPLHRPWAGTGGDRDSRRLGESGWPGRWGWGVGSFLTLRCHRQNDSASTWALLTGQDETPAGLLMFRLILRNKVTRLSTKPHLWETKKSRRRGESNRHRSVTNLSPILPLGHVGSRHNTFAVPRCAEADRCCFCYWCKFYSSHSPAKGCFPYRQSSVQTLFRCSYNPRVQSYALTSALDTITHTHKKVTHTHTQIQALATIPLFGHTQKKKKNTAHTRSASHEPEPCSCLFWALKVKLIQQPAVSVGHVTPCKGCNLMYL